jgi:hypothetical protein
MNSVAFLAAAIALLPVVGLAVMACFAIMNEAATVHSFKGFDGLHFEE